MRAVGRYAVAEVPERPLPIRDASLGAACGAVPDDRIVVSDAGVHAALVALAALEAPWSSCVIRPVEIRRMGDYRGDEFGHLAGRTPLGTDVSFVVEVVADVDHVHGGFSSLPAACICVSGPCPPKAALSATTVSPSTDAIHPFSIPRTIRSRKSDEIGFLMASTSSGQGITLSFPNEPVDPSISPGALEVS